MCGYVGSISPIIITSSHQIRTVESLSWRKTHFDFEVIAESVQRRQWSIVEARKPQSFPQTPLPFRSLSVKHQRTPVKTGIFLIWCVLAKCPMTTTTTTRKLISHQFVRFCQTNIDGDDDEVMGVTVCPYYCGVFLLCTNSQSSSFPSSGQMMLSRIIIMVTMKTKTGVNIDEDLAWYSMMIRTVMTIIIIMLMVMMIIMTILITNRENNVLNV